MITPSASGRNPSKEEDNLLKRLQISQHRRNQLRNRRMDVHGPLDRRVRCPCIHNVHDAVDRLVPTNSKDRGPKNLLRLSIHENLHESLGFALLNRAIHLRHWPSAYQRCFARLANLALRHPDSPQRRIGKESIDRQAVAHSPRIVVQQVRRDNLEVVVRRMRESSSSIAVAHRPYSRNVRTKLVIHHDVAMFICLDARLLQPEIVRVRPPSHREQYVRTNYLGISLCTGHANCDILSTWLELNALSTHSHINLFLLENVLNRRRNVLILVPHNACGPLDNRHFAAKTTEHLGKFNPDVPTSNHHEVLRKFLQIQQR